MNDVPVSVRAKGQRTFRSITCDGENVEFSDGFTDLHTRNYEDILKGNGFGPEENRVAIDTVAHNRHAVTARLIGWVSEYGEQIPFAPAWLGLVHLPARWYSVSFEW